MDRPTSSIVDSIVSFTTESLSLDITGNLTPSTVGVTPPPHTKYYNIFVGATPTMSSIKAMVSTMLETPSRFDGESIASNVGSSHSSNIRATYASMVNPSIPHTIRAQPVIGTWSLFSSQSSLPQPALFSRTFYMWSMPHIGNSPLNIQSSPSKNPITSSQFAPGSLGLFHPRSGVSPPFPSGNTNTNPTLGSSTSFSFQWNQNSTTLHG